MGGSNQPLVRRIAILLPAGWFAQSDNDVGLEDALFPDR
jgi:hypothetical protein